MGVLLAELQLPHLGHFHTKLTVQTSVKNKEAHHTVHLILQPMSIVFQEIIGSFKDNLVRFTLGNLRQRGSRDPQALTTLGACAQSEPVLLNAQPGKGRDRHSSKEQFCSHDNTLRSHSHHPNQRHQEQLTWGEDEWVPVENQ